MKKIVSIVIVVVVALSMACNRPKTATVEVPIMQTSADSMSYVLGLNIGRNLMGIDSLLNIDAVCEGLRDAYFSEDKLNAEEARAAYLKYMNYDVYERVKAFENQFLEDLRKADRKFVATSSGLTYKVHTLGDMKKVIRNNRDTILVQYRMLNVAGEVVDTTGAGDAFCAGFLFGISKGWSYERSAKLASVVSAFCIEERGASSGIKSFELTLKAIGIDNENDF